MTAATKSRTGLVRLPSRRKLGDEVARQIRDAIMTGTYVAGEKLVVEELANRLGVSTTPVREALVALAHEGILQASPRRGFSVALLGKQDIEDIFRVQAFLAGVLAARAAPIIDERTLDKLRAFQTRIAVLASDGTLEQAMPKIEELNNTFHYAINHVVDAPRIRWFMSAATQYVPRHVYETIPSWTQMTIDDHPAIIEALASHDATTARKRVEAHVMHTGIQLVENLQERGFWPR